MAKQSPKEVDWNRYFSCDPSDGIITWRSRPESDFTTLRVFHTWNTRFAGKQAGSCTVRHTGVRKCVQVRLDGVFYKAHRIIWEMHHGPIPDKMDIDHIDGNPWNNGIGNLRLATRSQNSHNSIISKRNTSGYKGVSRCCSSGKWRARIGVGGAEVRLGVFDSMQAAVQAREAASRSIVGAFTRSVTSVAK